MPIKDLANWDCVVRVVGVILSVWLLLYFVFPRSSSKSSGKVPWTGDKYCSDFDTNNFLEQLNQRQIQGNQTALQNFSFQYNLSISTNNGSFSCPHCPNWMNAFLQITVQHGISTMKEGNQALDIRESYLQVQGRMSGVGNDTHFELNHVTMAKTYMKSPLNDHSVHNVGGRVVEEKFVNPTTIGRSCCKPVGEMDNRSRRLLEVICLSRKETNPLRYFEDKILGVKTMQVTELTDIENSGRSSLRTISVLHGGIGLKQMQENVEDMEAERKKVCQCPWSKQDGLRVLQERCVTANSKNEVFRYFFLNVYLCHKTAGH